MDETAEIDRTISEGSVAFQGVVSSICNSTYYIYLRKNMLYIGSKSIAATSGLPEDDIEDLEKELEDLMMDVSRPGVCLGL